MMKTADFNIPFRMPFEVAQPYTRSVAYFSMEFAIDQSLKIYSGGLGFLAGSHMRSAYSLGQNLLGIGMLWKYGYYDQGRKRDNSMTPEYHEKMYHFLVDTQIRFEIPIGGRSVQVAAYYLPPHVFHTAPLFLLTTDTDGNSEADRAISYNLYDNTPETRVAQCMILGIGGVKLLKALGHQPDIYHFNEAHALSAAFYLYEDGRNLDKLKSQLVFTTHTPEEAGNEKHDMVYLKSLGFFGDLTLEEIREISGHRGDVFNHSLAALSMSKKANAVSQLHGGVARKMWEGHGQICPIIHITNAQKKSYWVDEPLEVARISRNVSALRARKLELKKRLLEVVADQTGKLFDPHVVTMVWARRFATYKRPDMLIWDLERFKKLMNDSPYPIQVIWAGKPYPKDEGAIKTFNELFYLSHYFPNMAVLTGYELALSKLLKQGADVWLNTPVVTREASGTSGMTAAMNASLNLSTFDGWICEFAVHQQNAFLLPSIQEGDINGIDANNLFHCLNAEVLPTYYDRPDIWTKMVFRSMDDVSTAFDSDRMAQEYYTKLYN